MGVLLGLFFSSMGIGFSGALMPGPMLSVTIAESYKKGFWAGPLVVLGHAIPEFILMILFSLGLNQYVQNDTVTGIIGVAHPASKISKERGNINLIINLKLPYGDLVFKLE